MIIFCLEANSYGFKVYIIHLSMCYWWTWQSCCRFLYVFDAVVYNDYHDLRNNCPCNSGHTHYFAYVYCRKHGETFTMLLELQLDSVLINLELLVMIILMTWICFIWRSLLKYVCLGALIYTFWCMVILNLTTFFSAVKKLKTIEMNRWISSSMKSLRKFYLNEYVTFVYNELLQEYRVATADIKLFHKGSNGNYSSSDFEKKLNKQWTFSNCKHWARVHIYVMDSVLYFAKRNIFGTHLLI